MNLVPLSSACKDKHDKLYIRNISPFNLMKYSGVNAQCRRHGRNKPIKLAELLKDLSTLFAESIIKFMQSIKLIKQ